MQDASRTGTLAFITPDVVLAGVATVRDGETFALNLPISVSDAPPFGRRPAQRTLRQHNEVFELPDGRFAVWNDDRLDLPLQGGSHWDSLAHFGVLDSSDRSVFFGARGLEETSPEPRAKSLGIDTMAQGVVTRGVLLDLVTTICGPDAQWLPDDTRISTAHVEACLAAQGVTLRRGDGVLVYTGFGSRFAECPPEARAALESANAGLDSSTMDLWEQAQISFLASDNLAVEAIPLDLGIHEGALRRLGLPLGELWALDRLAKACRVDSRFEFLFAAAPLNIPGAFGSPANAVAIR
jgi:kynurenine formamidase